MQITALFLHGLLRYTKVKLHVPLKYNEGDDIGKAVYTCSDKYFGMNFIVR